MTWYVYLIECADGSLYAGITNNVTRRIEAHNSGTGARYTRPESRRPVRLMWTLPCINRSVATKEEARIKKLRREQKLALIEEGVSDGEAGLRR